MSWSLADTSSREGNVAPGGLSASEIDRFQREHWERDEGVDRCMSCGKNFTVMSTYTHLSRETARV